MHAKITPIKLTRLGVPTSVEDILTSSLVMVDFLKRRMPGARLFVVGEEPLCAELRRGGFELTEQAHNVDAVIASFDRTFVYRKLQIAFDAIRAGARFFATNPDRYCPVPSAVSQTALPSLLPSRPVPIRRSKPWSASHPTT